MAFLIIVILIWFVSKPFEHEREVLIVSSIFFGILLVIGIIGAIAIRV